MNNINKVFFIISSLILANACSNNKSTSQYSPPQFQNNETIVVIYRPTVVANTMYLPDLYINDEFRVSINDSTKYHFRLVPGNYKLELKSKDNILVNHLKDKQLKAGEIYYYKIDTLLRLNSSTQYKPYHREFTIRPMNEDSALQQISNCCLKNNSAITIEDNKNNRKKSSPSFSVDKTQNPFSH